MVPFKGIAKNYLYSAKIKNKMTKMVTNMILTLLDFQNKFVSGLR